MSRGGGVVLVWASWISALTVILAAWTPDNWVQWSPFAAVSIAGWIVGLLLLLRGRSSSERLLPDYSPPTVLLVLGLAAAAASPSFGLWLLLVGVGMAAAGALGLARETLAGRRRLR